MRNALVEILTGRAEVRDAALVAHTFGQDPVALLKGSSLFDMAVRVAAHNIIQAERSKESK